MAGRPGPAGVHTVADYIHRSHSDQHDSNGRGSSQFERPGVRRPGRIERSVAVVAGAFSVVVLAAILASAPDPEPVTVPHETQVQPAPERGDPALGQRLA